MSQASKYQLVLKENDFDCDLLSLDPKLAYKDGLFGASHCNLEKKMVRVISSKELFRLESLSI